MQNISDKLTEIFDKGCENGISALNKEEIPYYYSQFFIISIEMDGLSGFLYNTLPDFFKIDTIVNSLRQVGLDKLVFILEKVRMQFAEYKDPEVASTWEKQLLIYDPNKLLDKYENELYEAIKNENI
jgi:hypothetical protein